ncbi:hypothetical protein [Atopococcus tabaci]|uniref:hypothetical protein n=1 Tax=Atopococcus tabaci TaxID=269774 RepID=UPI0004134411|nr:hypothetical protein [Atopococcus tabaci]
MSNPNGLWMLAALLVVLVIAFRTNNVLYGLVIVVVTASVIGLITGLFTFGDFMYFVPETGEMGGLVPDGVMALSGFLVSLIFLYCVIEVMNQSGAIDVLTTKLATYSFMRKPLGVELVSSIVVMIGSVLLSGMVIPAILIVSSLMNRLGEAAGLDKTRRTNMLIMASTSVSPLIPISSVYLNGTVGDVASLQRVYPFIQNIDPFTTFFASIYNWLTLVIVLVWIFAGVNRKQETMTEPKLASVEKMSK